MNNHRATFFNPTLFSKDKNPMKFFLDGYTNHEVSEIARIIEAFGGKLSSPDENTIIFSEPGRPVTTDHCRYHIQCLYDSIVARRFQELEKYRIPLIKHEFIESSISEIPVPLQQLPDNSSTLNPCPSLLKPWKIVQVSSYAEMHEKNAVESSKKFTESDISEEADSESSELNNNKRIKKRRTPGTIKNHSERENLNLEETKAFKRKRDLDRDSSDSCSEENVVPNKKRRGSINYWSDEENRLMIQYLIDNTAISTANGIKIWEDMESELILVNPYRSASSMHGHYLQKLKYRIDDYVNDPAVLEQFRKLNDTGKKLQRGKRLGKYSESDKRKIIKYLIDNKAISRAYEEETWMEMEAAGVTDRQRKAKSLRKLFINHLQYDVANYVNDPEILKEFENLRIHELDLNKNNP